MTPTTYQAPEIRDSNDNVIKQGSFGKNTALANSTNDGWIDYVANDLEFLYGLAKDEVVPVSELPSTGDTNKTYLLTTTGVCYRWDGTEWVEISSSEAVSRADSAAYLAEQWATKTSGTVDGTEYSAKYYAEQAQDTADDLSESLEQIATNTANIEENAENIATNTGNIAQNTTDIDIADKRISNIEKLLQGNLYDYQTDTDSTYTKTVLSGAMPYASLDSIGGKTVVMNQLFNYASYSTETKNDVTCTKNNDGSFTFTGTANAQANFWFHNGSWFTENHKYYINCPAGASSSTYKWYQSNVGSNRYDDFIFTSTGAYRNGFWYLLIPGGVSVNFTYSPMFIDLTLLYGAGNEPSTVAEFKQTFPAQYYPYNAGTLLAAGVTEVVSKGKNLAYYGDGLGVPSNTSYSNTTKRFFPVGKYYTNLTANNYYNSNRVTVTAQGTSLTVTSVQSGYGCAIPFDCIGGADYSFSFTASASATVLSSVTWYDKSGGYISFVAGSTATSYKVTAPSNAEHGFLLLRTNEGSPITFDKIQIEKSSTATAYSPYQEHTYPIPAEIRALEGYGWSAGSVHNYVDFERKVFVKCVGAIDLGSVDFSALSTPEKHVFRATLSDFPNIKPPANNNYTVNAISSMYMVMAYNPISANDNLRFAVSVETKDRVVFINQAYSTVESFTSAMSGVYLYYELKNPIETDISAYITDDNLIEVEAGGSLTFPNSNGDDYQIPVPSSETYMVDLQEAIS